MILDQVLKGLRGFLTVSAENILQRVNQSAIDIHKKLSRELKNRFVRLIGRGISYR